MTTQLDWTGEQVGINPDIVLCANPKCLKPLRNSKEDRFYGRSSGRPSDYCSDACKMKSYRNRQKSLRNVQQVEQLQIEVLPSDEQIEKQKQIDLVIDAYNAVLGREHVEGDTYILFGLQVVKHWDAGWKVQELVKLS